MGVITRSGRIQWLNGQDYFQYYRNRLITFLIFQSKVSILLVSISKCTNVIRNQHTRKTEERENYFGIEREILDSLRRIKKSLTDSFKLYVATVVVMAVLTFIRIFEMILNKHMISVNFFLLIMHMSDIAVISSTQREIRVQLKHTILMCCYRYGATPNIVTSNVSVLNGNQ